MSKTIFPPTLLCDFYKIAHRKQYPDKTETVFSTWIPRSNKHYPYVKDGVIAFAFQGFVKQWIMDYFDDHFFNIRISKVIYDYTRYCKHCLSEENPYTKHLEDLHDLGYIPLEIKAVPEGTRVPFRVPTMTVVNTDTRFFWLTNYFETLMSTELWPGCTSATIAARYRKILDKYSLLTVGNTEFVPFQGHDFSMRGIIGMYGGALISSGHLLSFVGTDTIPSICYHEEYYNANIETELVGCSIPATEHSTMCAGSRRGEFETYKRLITEVYPGGFISIVSDTWDLWECIDGIIKPLKHEIMARDGKVVIRPDSGNPADIICGDPDYEPGTPQRKGVVQLLWEIFGGVTNDLGFKELDPHIGAIYGDSITPEVAEDICVRLKESGFASTNVVFGIGSYTYQYNTRDTFGFAMKSTAVVIDGVESAIYKDPVTDDGTKKSLTGGVAVQYSKSGELTVLDGLPIYHNEPDLLRTIYKDGDLLIDDSLEEIRERLRI